MPGIPTHGAAGGLSFTGDKPPVGKEDEGPPAPKHGAAGGYDIPFPWRGNPEPSRGETGMTRDHPAVGPKNKFNPKKLAG